MQERGRVFGLFLAGMMKEVKTNIRTLCRASNISETHTLRGKMMKGIPVDDEVYIRVYVVLKSVLLSRPSLEYRILLAQLEESFLEYHAPLPLSLLLRLLR